MKNINNDNNLELTNEQLAAQIELWFNNNLNNTRMFSNNKVGKVIKNNLVKRGNFKDKPRGNASKGGKAAMIKLEYKNGWIDKQTRDSKLEELQIGVSKRKESIPTGVSKRNNNNSNISNSALEIIKKYAPESLEDKSIRILPNGKKEYSGEGDCF